jgi:P4 family phage/plasmid primase-like protien
MSNKKRAADSGKDQQPRNTSLCTGDIQQSGGSVKGNESDHIAFPPEQKIPFTLMRKTKGILTKRMKFIEGRVEKDSSECRMSKGRAETVTLTPEEFGPFLQGLQSNQAIVHGVSDYNKAGIVSGRRLKTKADEEPRTDKQGLPIISRTKDFFHYPTGPGLLMLDHDKARTNAVALDPEKALKAYSPEELITIIAGIFSAIKGAARVSTCSTSSCIYDAVTGKELRGKSAGFHLYLFPKNAQDIPRFLDVLGKRLVLAGYGRVEFSRSGAVLLRTLVDLLVASPERLDFVAGAICDKGLEQRLPAPEYQPGELLDTQALKDLNPEEEKAYQEIIRQLKAKGAPDQERIKGAYLEQEAKKLRSESKGKISMEQARETVKARQHHILIDDDLLFFAHEKKLVSVAYVLENGQAFDNESCADPLEPEYDGGSRSKAVFYWNEGQTPLIFSHAHGGIKYRFERFQQAEQDVKKESEVWSFDDVEALLNLHPAMLKWYVCAEPDTELTRAQKNVIAEDILLHNSFNHLEIDAVKDMLKKQLGISKGAQDKVLKNSSAAPDNPMEDATHSEIAHDYIASEFPDRKKHVGAEGYLWISNEQGIFEEKKLITIESEIGRRYNGNYCKRGSDYKAVTRLIYNSLEQSDFFENAPYGIPARSGFIQLADKGEITTKQYKPEHRQRYTLQVDPAETGTPCPLFTQYLEDSFTGLDMTEQITLLQEILGAILTGCFSRMQKAVLLLGEGENGKSVILDLLESMFPPGLKAAVPPERFDDPYYLSQLAGRVVNIVGELDKSKPLKAIFKDVVGCDTPCTARLPYKEPFTFRPRTAHIFSSNSFPQSNDHCHGFYRRWIILEFRNVVPPERKIPNLGEKIAAEEMSQVLAWALQGAKRLAANNFTLSVTKAHDRSLEKWQNAKDSVYGFLHDDEAVERAEDGCRVPKKEVYKAYKDWCSEMGSKAVGYQEFLRRCGKQFNEVKFPGENRSFAGMRLACE